jgi:hypothetical protein
VSFLVNERCPDFRSKSRLIAGTPLGLGQNPINRRYADPHAPGDLGTLQSLGFEFDLLSSFGTCRGFPAFVFAVSFCLGNALTLTFQQKPSLEFGNSPKHGNH